MAKINRRWNFFVSKKYMQNSTIYRKTKIEEILINPKLIEMTEYQEAIYQVLRCLENGTLRIASPCDHAPDCGSVPMNNLQNWIVHTWVKDAILLAMKMRTAQTVKTSIEATVERDYQGRVHMNGSAYHDKFDLQTAFAEQNVRALPGAIVREGSHVANGVILMPSFVNIGAWVGENTMIDTWATVGSCAQIGKNVHIAGGAGIGGVLEPINARPVLIGDGAFIGSRAIVVEGVVVGENAIIGANCCLTISTPIYDVTTSEKTEYRGYVPPGAVVVPGTRSRDFPGGEVALACCYIIQYREKKQDDKLMLNQVLRAQSSLVSSQTTTITAN